MKVRDLLTRYVVMYEDGPKNLSGFVPDVPGCVSAGKTLSELRVNIREALEFHLEGLALSDHSMPAAVSQVGELPEHTSSEWISVMFPADWAAS